MITNLQKIKGNWDLGYSLDKHVISSVYIGDNEYGKPQFDTKRSEMGEALYQLKYKFDNTKSLPIAQQMVNSLSPLFKPSFIIPMPASKARQIQPVTEITKHISVLMNIPYIENILVKKASEIQLKDIDNKEDKIQTLLGIFSFNDKLAGGLYDVLVIDDLYDTGATLEAATTTLRNYEKIRHIFVATVTRRR
jgi:predicted amidophosphoribosyltransferase